jgi:hypothetical protein
MRFRIQTGGLLTAGAIATALLLMPLPIAPLVRRWPALLHEVENLGHPLLFGLLAAAGFLTLRARWPAPSHAPYVGVLAAALIFGLATEALQQLLGRDAAWEDLLNDVLGAVFALLLCARKEQRGRVHVGAAALLAVAMLGPLFWVATAYAHRALQMPVLWRANSMLFEPFFRWQGGAYPGLVIDEPAADWSRHTTLELKLRNLRNEVSPVVVRVHDLTHTLRYADRFNETFGLPVGAAHTIRIPLEQIRRSPRGREMDMRRISGVVIFQTAAKQPRFFDVLEIRLE